MNVKFDEQLGKKFKFYGVCDTCFKIGPKVFNAVEDPSDGYRSYLDNVELLGDVSNLTFFRTSIAEVTIKESSTVSGYDFVDDSGHVWLTIGTDYYDDYYPCFTFRYSPKKS